MSLEMELPEIGKIAAVDLKNTPKPTSRQANAGAGNDIQWRQALQLGMPVGVEHFAEVLCGCLSIRHNSGQRGRPNRPADEASKQGVMEQQDFGF